MTESIRDFALFLNSTREVLAGWSIHDDGECDSAVAPDHIASGSDQQNRADSNGDALAAWRAGQSVELMAAFALDASVPNSVRSPNLRSTFDHPPTNGEHSTNQEKENAAVSTQKRGLAALPQPGDELAGFRIITELGRGAFVRLPRRRNQPGPAACGHQGFEARWQ